MLGADAVLLIAAILSEVKLLKLSRLAASLGLFCLTEVHNEEELQKVIRCKCDIIGINNRDLKTFHVDLNTTKRLAELVPYDAVLVSESGLKNGADIREVKEYGADAVLIGETLMRAGDIKNTINELRGSL